MLYKSIQFFRTFTHLANSSGASKPNKPASVSPLLHQQILHLSSAVLERQKNNHNFFQRCLTLMSAEMKQ